MRPGVILPAIFMLTINPCLAFYNIAPIPITIAILLRIALCAITGFGMTTLMHQNRIEMTLVNIRNILRENSAKIAPVASSASPFPSEVSPLRF